jgi:hypothetical protein
MSNINARSVRIGFFTLAAAMILTAALADDAAARHRVHTAHFRALNARAQYVQSVPVQGEHRAHRYALLWRSEVSDVARSGRELESPRANPACVLSEVA